jgi:hypothetical protein
MRRPDASRRAELAAACAAVPIVLIALARALFLRGRRWDGVASGFVLLAASGFTRLVPLALRIAAVNGGTEKPVRALVAATSPTLVVTHGWLSA